MSLLFAALHPDRVAALCVYGSLPRFLWAPDFPWGRPKAEWERELEHDVEGWGTTELVREWVPTASEQELEALARAQRLSGSPNAYRQIEQMNQAIDVRHVLPSIAVPTLVLHRSEDHLPVEGAEWMAEQIPVHDSCGCRADRIWRFSANGRKSSTKRTASSNTLARSAGRSPNPSAS